MNKYEQQTAVHCLTNISDKKNVNSIMKWMWVCFVFQPSSPSRPADNLRLSTMEFNTAGNPDQNPLGQRKKTAFCPFIALPRFSSKKGTHTSTVKNMGPFKKCRATFTVCGCWSKLSRYQCVLCAPTRNAKKGKFSKDLWRPFAAFSLVYSKLSADSMSFFGNEEFKTMHFVWPLS